jgi:hypothetical protein
MKNPSAASLALTGAPTAATSRRAPANTAFLIWIKYHAIATGSLERESFARHRRQARKDAHNGEKRNA